MPIDLLDRVPPQPDQRIPYGVEEFQFGELWLPESSGLRPVVVFVHGGWWKAEYGLAYGGHLCKALRSKGIVCWSLEYRRVGNRGGGWPGTFLDVAAGFDHLEALGSRFRLDLNRIVVLGHSAGGQLAFWLAGRQHIPQGSVLAHPLPRLSIRSAIALAGAVDLQMTIELAGNGVFAHDRDEVLNLMGASPQQAPERYRAGDPGQLLPLNLPQVLIQGTDDDQIPAALPARWAERGRRRAEPVTVCMVPGADHFDVVDPESKAWPVVEHAVLEALRR